MAADPSRPATCLVVGAGPVGALAALYAARRGWNVHVYELRSDLRDEAITPLNFTKSINLALSERGINAMQHSASPGLVGRVLADTIPMHGRMVHGQDASGDWTEEEQKYDPVHGRFIRAVDRAGLNKLLLDEVESMPNVTLHFNHKLTGADLRQRKAWFEQHGHASGGKGRAQEIEVDFDIMLGCDGAHSAVRYHMMKYVRMTYSQSYIDTLWSEFTIPPANPSDAATTAKSDVGAAFATPSARDGFASSPNHLHIWPGKEHMFIAIPSLDRSFTCTLFATSAAFSSLEQHPESIASFFQHNFPGVAELVGGPQRLREQFERNPHLPLISIKCSPHTFDACAVILGDAAHAMVPFYGQGMNAGLEDVRVLFSHLDAHPSTTDGRTSALHAYATEREPDAHTINDLAMGNYWEMHAGVRSPLYRLRKAVEEWLSDKLPWTGFRTQYARVSFSNERYSLVRLAVARQGRALVGGVAAAFLALLSTPLVIWIIRWHRLRRRIVRNLTNST